MTEIIALIDAEIAQLQQARAVIAGAATTTTKRGPGRPAKSATVATKPKKRRNLSPEGRAHIVAALKARWAAKKKAAAK